MDKEDILRTKISLQGDFFDMALYSGVLYLWKNDHQVSLYHWDKWMDQLLPHKLPVYTESVPNQSISCRLDQLKPYYIKTITFDQPVLDFVLFNHILYFINQDGLSSVLPASADLAVTSLAKGEFHSLALSNKDRLALSSTTNGLFEYILTSQYQKTKQESSLIQWNKQPTADVFWDEHNLLQLNEAGQPIQRIDFNVKNQSISVSKQFSQDHLQEYHNYYLSSLDLHEEREAESFVPLFEYLPSKTTDNTVEGEIPIEFMPHHYFRSTLLADDVLYLDENEAGLTLILGNNDYYKWLKKDYKDFRSYPKSRNYRHHLHLLTKNALEFYIFHSYQ